jgi:hypothetical protein
MKKFLYNLIFLSGRERDFIWFMQMLEEKYNYACKISGYDLNFNEFVSWYIKNLEDEL